jgi:putative peptide zinc metalloprotease protein
MTRLGVRMRPELVLTPHGVGSTSHWIVEDPVTLKYFRLRDEECFILRGLGEHADLQGLKRAFDSRFYPIRTSLTTLNRFLFQLHELGLIVGEGLVVGDRGIDAVGQGEVLARRDLKRRRDRSFAALTNPLAIRLPGFSARQAIDRVYPHVAWLFSPAMLVAYAALVIVALLMVVTRFEAFRSRLPGVEQFFATRSLLGLAGVLAMTKTLHELGHAFVSRHLGGSCREIGVLLLALTPTLYCDTSDAWRLTNKSSRVLISLAGIMVELVLAAVATLVWWFSEPGWVHDTALQVMALACIASILFNANPLIRSDAYFVLADAFEIPNLWQESRAAVRRVLTRLLTGKPSSDRPQTPQSKSRVAMLVLYAVASTLYRWALLIGLLWLAYRLLEPKGLAVLAWLLGGLVAVGMMSGPAKTMAKAIASPATRATLSNPKTFFRPLTLAAILAAIVAVPLPARVNAPFWIELDQATSLYASVGGTLVTAVRDGESVRANQTLVTLRDTTLELQIQRLEGEVDRLETRLENMRTLQAGDAELSAMIPGEETTLAETRRQLELLQEDLRRLTIRSPIDGTVFAPARKTDQEGERGRLTGWARLPGWTGSPLDPVNAGALIESGQVVCAVGDPRRVRANLVIDQASVVDLKIGQSVALRLDQAPVRTLRGKITAIAKTTSDEIDPSMIRRLGIDSPATISGDAQAARYQATVTFETTPEATTPEETTSIIPPDTTGWAKVSVGWRSLGSRAMRFLSRTFVIR